MPFKSRTPAIRGSNYEIPITFKIPVNNDWVNITPDTVRWTLKDKRDNVISYNVDVGELASSIVIVLNGVNLEPIDGETSDIDPVRILIIEATYSYGVVSNLPWRDWVEFVILDA